MEYNKFFEEIKKFKEIQEQQMQRGLNDFNLLTTVRKYHDEVYLHSAMIGALLNPQGLHYQKTLFLELFLKELGLHEWGLNLDKVSVHVEYKDIDLYITDGIKHIIIENKIWAKDQECQIIKYINIIIQENQKTFQNLQENDCIDDNYLRVIYLTAQSKVVPDEHEVDDGYISFCGGDTKLKECSQKDHTKALVPGDLQNYKASYQRNTYKNILQWLKDSKKQVSNITNLNEAIKQYISVIEMVNNNYKGNVMSLKEYITEENNLEFDTLKDVVEKYNKMIKESEKEYLKNLKVKIKNYVSILDHENNNYIKIIIKDDIYLQTGIKNGSAFITIYHKDWKDIEKDKKNIVFNKLKDMTVMDKIFDAVPKWENVYATILDIINVESKEFLSEEINANIVFDTIKQIKEKLNDPI